MTKLAYESTPEFLKDLKKLSKKFPTLQEDLAVVQRNVIELFHLQDIKNQATFELQGFANTQCSFWKIKKFACRSLKGRGAHSGIRLIYAYHSLEHRIVFLEMYFKAEQENETKERIKNYLKN